MFNFAIKRRHFPSYAENPFTVIEIDRIPVEDATPIVDLTPAQERELLERCDDWQFPIFLTLTLTGLRPGELTHLLLPHDLDLENGWLHVRNKPRLGWQVKTRNERRIPLGDELRDVLTVLVDNRQTGPVFLRRRFEKDPPPALCHLDARQLQEVLANNVASQETNMGESMSRTGAHRAAQKLWRDMGAIRADRLRIQFMHVTHAIGLPDLTAPKTLRHLFATALQDANVDPLIRNQLMGHAPITGAARGGLGMTGHYTHTRPDTMRRQLESALRSRPGLAVAKAWLTRCGRHASAVA